MKIYEIEAGARINLHDPESQDTVKDFADVVKANCSDVLAIYKSAGKVLYRGMITSELPAMFHARSRNNRNPTNIKRLEAQKGFDAALAKNGIVANRSNSIFCSGDISQAYVYADSDKDLYMIFPANGFNYAWSPRVRDLLNDHDFKWWQGQDQEVYNKFVTSKEYKNTDLGMGLISGHEIMISGEYYAIQRKYDNTVLRYLFQ